LFSVSLAVHPRLASKLAKSAAMPEFYAYFESVEKVAKKIMRKHS
jgi:hypothetical protein